MLNFIYENIERSWMLEFYENGSSDATKKKKNLAMHLVLSHKAVP